MNELKSVEWKMNCVRFRLVVIVWKSVSARFGFSTQRFCIRVCVRLYQLSRRWFSRSQNLHSLFFSFRVDCNFCFVLAFCSFIKVAAATAVDRPYIFTFYGFLCFFYFCFKYRILSGFCCYLKQKVCQIFEFLRMFNTTIFGRTTVINLIFSSLVQMWRDAWVRAWCFNFLSYSD